MSNITTGLVIAYSNSFEIMIYNIQKPSKELVPFDYSIDNLNKLILQRKTQGKKKVDKSLATLVKTLRSKEESNQKSIIA